MAAIRDELQRSWSELGVEPDYWPSAGGQALVL